MQGYAQNLILHYPFGPEENNTENQVQPAIILESPMPMSLTGPLNEPVLISFNPERAANRLGEDEAAYSFGVTTFFANDVVQVFPKVFRQTTPVDITNAYSLSAWFRVSSRPFPEGTILSVGQAGTDIPCL